MIISMKLHAPREERIQEHEQVARFGYKVHSIEGEERVVIGVVGVGDVTACLESVEAMPQVEKGKRNAAPHNVVSKEFGTRRLQSWLNRIHARSNDVNVVARPCSVESEKQIMA